LAVLAVAILSTLAWGQQTPIPTKSARAKAEALIREIFKDDLAQAGDSKDGSLKSKLAAVFLQQGRESEGKEEATNRFMLYQMAADLAAQAGDAQLALTAVDELARSFAVNALELKVAVLVASGKHTESTEANKTLVDLIMPMIAGAVDADDYDVALKLSQVALDAAKKSKNLPLVTAVQKRDQEVRAVQKGFAHLKPFVERLKKDPTDAEANLELGKYYGLLKGKWDRALPLLALGSDETLGRLARDDLGNKLEKNQLALADAWWNLAQKQKDPAKLHLQARAKVWYEKAVLNLAGLNRTKALRRLDQINARLQGVSTTGPQGPIGELKKFEGHTDEIKAVAISADGRYAASGGLDQTVRIWNLITGKEEQVLRGHTGQIWSVVFHPNNRQVLSGSWDGTVRLWDIKSGMESKKIKNPKDVNGVAITRDGSKILSGCDNQNAFLWNAVTGEEIRRYGGFKDYVYAVAFAPDGRHIACSSNDRSLRVFEMNTGQTVRAWEGLSDPALAVAFSPDSRYVFSSGGNAVQQLDISSGKEVRRFEGHDGRVLGMALSVDGRRLVTGGDDLTVRLWNVATGKETEFFKGHQGVLKPTFRGKGFRHTQTVNAVAISTDGRFAISAGLDKTVRLWGLPR
jgi:hypothetical protein